MQSMLRRHLLPPFSAIGRYLPAALLGILAIGGVLSGIFVKPWTPNYVMGLGRLSSIAAWLLLLLVARALARGKRQAWLLSVCLLALVGAVSMQNRSMRSLLPLILGGLLAFIIMAPLFRRRSDPGASIRGYAALAVGLVTLYSQRVIYALVHRITYQAHTPLFVIHVAAFIFLGVGIVEILRPVLPQRVARDIGANRARGVVLRYGVRSLAHYTLGPNMSYYWNASGQAFLAYRVHRGVAVMLGDPVGQEGDLGHLMREFQAFCRRQDWELAIYQASPTTLEYFASSAIHAIKVGEEAIVDTGRFTVQGKIGAPVRHAIARARRGNVTISIWQGEVLSEPIFAGMKRINMAWLKAQHTYGQMGFSMGRFPADWSPDLLTVVAQGEEGDVLAFLTWTPLYRGNGWTLDNMRRAGNTVPGTMEYLIAESLEWARTRGYGTMSLSLAPLVGLREELQGTNNAIAPPRGRISHSARLFQRSAAYIHRRGLLLGNYRSLYFFKQKFQPTWEPRYLVLSDASSLPRVLVALASVHGMELRTAAHEIWASLRLFRIGKPPDAT